MIFARASALLQYFSLLSRGRTKERVFVCACVMIMNASTRARFSRDAYNRAHLRAKREGKLNCSQSDGQTEEMRLRKQKKKKRTSFFGCGRVRFALRLFGEREECEEQRMGQCVG